MVMVSFHYLEYCLKVEVTFVFFSVAVMVALGSNVVNPIPNNEMTPLPYLNLV
jgi:hypothetical protein